MENRGLKRGLLLVNALLIFGLAVYVVAFLFMNRNLNPADISGNSELLLQRLSWRSHAEAIYLLCGDIYKLGHVLLLFWAVMRGVSVSLKQVSIYFTIQIGIMFLCMVPAVVFDFAHLGDYLFPVWGLAATLFVILTVYILYCTFRKTIRWK